MKGCVPLKKKWIFLCFLLLLLTGCSGGTKKLRFGTAGIGGVYHAFADTFANILNTETDDFQTEVKTTAGSAANLGCCQMAISSWRLSRQIFFRMPGTVRGALLAERLARAMAQWQLSTQRPVRS